MGVLTVRWIYRLWPLTLLAAAGRGANAGELAPDTLPGGGTVVGGQADISTDGARMDIAQRTERAIIDWQSFDIGSEARVSFLQPTDTSVALNRVSGATASRLEGQLTANGQVFLVNPNGVLFGGGARVDASAFVASTLNISDNDFLTGRYSFSGAGGAIENFGTISAAPGGYLAFIAPTITNAGTLNAPQGTVALGAGERVTLNFSGNRLLGLSVEAETLDTLIDNRQAIRADGGAILLTAAGAESVTRSVINQAGVLEASSLTEDGGEIVLSAGDDIVLGSSSLIAADGERGGDVHLQANSGTLMAEGRVSARGDDGAGGTVELLGHDVGLVNAAHVDVSGGAGGGTVLVGGDYQGSNPAIQNASRTFVDGAAVIVADARDDGDGGKVVVWADDATQMYGAISARGGVNGGDGGLVEVSGKRWLDFQGQADLRAVNGSTGTLLLDPTDITISGAASTPTSAFGGGVFSNPTTTPSNLNVATLASQLALGNVTVSAASALAGQGDITVNNAINYASANSLTLSANRTITLVAGSGGINNSGIGAVTLTGGAAGSITVNESITTGGGAIALTSGTAGITLAAAKSIDAGAGTIAINAGGGAANLTSGTLQTSNATASAVVVTNAAALTLGNVALTGGGTLSVNHSGAGTQAGGTSISGTGGLTKAGAGTLLLSQANAYGGPTTVSGGVLALTGGNAIGDTGAVSLADAAGVALELRASETIGSLAGGGAVGGNVTSTVAATLTTGRDGTSTNFAGVIQNGAGALGLIKEGAGTFTLTNANTYTGTTAASGGTLALAGAAGSLTVSNLTVNSGARLLLDNTAANNGNRIAGTLTSNGGEFAVTGNAAGNTTETLGALSLASGYSTITLTPDAARNTQVTFASLARTAGASALFRGNNLGANTVASQTAGSSNIVFTAAPALTGGGGNAGTPTVSIVAGAIGSGGALGSSGGGTDFLTYNPPTGAVNGLRPLLASEYAAAPAANVNLRLTANRAADDTFTINSLLLSGGVTYNYNATGGANTLTIGSGNVLSVGGTNTIQPTLATGAVAFGATDAKLFTVSDLILGANAAVTGTGILGKSGAGVLLENRGVARTGGIVVNSGTLRAGINNSFVSQAMTVRAAGTLDLNGFNHTVSALTLESGATTGANVVTGAGTLTLGGNVTLNANGTGAAGATVSGNLAAAATRTFTVNNGVAADDLSVSGVISGAGGLIKAGTGTLALSGPNTYTGATTINAGTLSASTLANGGAASSVGASTNAAANLVLGGGILQYNGGSVGTDRNYTLTAATTSSINVANAATNLTLSGASTATTGALTKLGAGTLTLSGANLYTGLTTVAAGRLAYGASNALAAGAVTVTGGATFDIGTFSDTVGAVTLTNGTIAGTSGTLTGASYAVASGLVSATLGGAGALTKSGAGTVALTAANAYTGVTTVGGGILAVTSLGNGGVASSIGASNNGAANLVFSNGILRYDGASVAIDRSYTLTAGTTGSIDVTNAATILTVGGASTATNGALTKLGAGTLTLTGANLNTGATTIRAGTLQVGNGGIAGNLGTGAVVNQGTLVLDRSDAMTLANVVSGFGELIKQGGGTTTLSGANTYTGVTTINAGTLQLGAANRIADASAVTVASGATFNLATFSDTVGSIAGAGNITLGTGTLTSGGTNASTTFSGVISGTGGIIKAGTGTLTLTGTNIYSGATTVGAGGTLQIGNGATTGSLGTGNVANQGILVLDRSDAVILANVVSGVGQLIKQGAGTTTLTGASTYTGSTTINVGTLQLGAANRIANTSAVTVASGATLNLASFAETVGSIAGAGNITLGTGTLTSGGDNTSTTFSGVISGTGGIGKAGTGSLTLTGANTYSGATNVTAGTLVAADAAALGATTNGTTVTAGATLNVANVALAGEALTLAGTGVGGVGALTGTGTASVSGAIGMAAAGTIGTTSAASSLTLSGVVTAPATLTIAGAGNVTAVNAANNFGTVAIPAGGNVSLRDANAITINASTLSGALSVQAAGALTVAGAVSAAGAGDALVLSGSRFVNNVGAAALSATNGRWLVWSSNANPFGGGTPDVRNGLVNDFKQYAATYGVTPVAQATGNGFLYSLAPSLTPGLTGTTGKVYDGTTAATLLAGNFTAAGAVDSDTVTLSSTGSSYANRNVGAGKVVTATGIGATASNGSATVYGYSLASTTAAANIGAITPASLTVTAQADSRGYDGSTSSSIAPLLSGTTYDAVGTTATQGFDNRNVGTGKTLTASGLVMADGNGGANYAIGYVNNTAGVITPASLTVTSQADSRVYDGTTASSVAPVLSGTTYDAVGTTATQAFDNRNVGTGKILTAGGLVMADGNSGANYSVSYVNDSSGVITPASVTVTAQADSRTYDGTAASTAAPILSGATYDVVGTAATQVFDNRNAGTGKTLTATGLVMADGNSGANYAINYVNDTAGVITPAGVTVTAQADSRIYDGTTASSAAPVSSGATYDAVGTAATQVFDNRNAGTGKTLTASGLVMADGNGGANYAINYVTNTAGVVAPASLTVTAQADSRVYDGTTASSAAPLVSGTTYDAVGTAATQVFDNRNAGTGKTLTASGLVMADGNGGANYAVNYVNDTAGVITPATLTVTAQADSRVYDGTTASSAAPLVSGTTYDAVGTAATQVFDNRNAGTGKTLTASGLVMADGNGGANYAVNYVNDTAGVITPATLTVTAQADSRVYDGTTASSSAPVLSGTTYEAVGTAATQVFDNRNAGTGKTLTASGLVMADGNGGANYAINYVTNTAGVITPASLTVTAQADSRTYDGTTASSAAPVLSGTMYDAVGTAATQAFDTRNAGTGKTLTATGLVMVDGNAGANYTISYVDNTAGVITPASLTVTSQADSRVYDGTTASSVAPVLSGTTYDAIGTAALQSFDDRNVGAGKALTASGLVMADGNGGTNYAVSYVNNTVGVITPAGVTVTAQVDSRVYDGTAVSSAAPVLSGTTYDAVGTAATQVFDNRNAGTGKTLAASGLVMADGNGGANYAVSYVNNTAGVITPASLTVTAQADSRGYDGTTASAAAPVLSGTTYDAVGSAATQVFDNRNAGTGKTLTASGLVMADGNSGANYAINYVNNTAGVIIPAGVTVTAQADSRVYDGTSASSVAPVMSGTTYDAVGTAALQSFDNRDVGTGKTLIASGLAMADGNGGANYAVNYVTNTAGVITPASLTVTAQADSRGYDGTTSSSVAPVLSGTTYDAVGTVAIQAFDNRNVGTGKTLTASGLVMADGNAGANYTVNYVNNTTGVITPAALTVTSQADSRVYDGTSASSVAPVMSGTTYDAVGTAALQSFDDRNVGAGKTLTASGLVMADGNGGANYAVSYVNNTAGVITPAGVTATAQADSRVYDGTTASSSAPVLSGTTYDAVGSAATQVFDDRNAGTGKTLTASGLVMADGNGGANYVISYVNNTAGVITPAGVTVTAQADSRVYDGTTASSSAPVLSGATYDAVGTAATQVFDDRNAGTGKTLTASGLVMADGNGGANYAINYVNNTAGVITPASLTVTAQADSRIYDGTTASSAAPVLSGTTYDAVGTVATQAFDNRNVGAGKTLTASGLVMADGNAGANYTVNYVNNTAGVIAPAALTVTSQADSRVYDGTTASSSAPVLSGTTYDAVGSAATQVFDNRNVGTGKTLTASGLVMADGNGGANYAISYVNNTAGVITPAGVTVTAQVDSRVYDGTAVSSAAPVLSGATYDAVGTAATQVYNNRNAGTGKTLTASGLVMADGNGGANYAISYVNNTAGVITPAGVTVTAQVDSRVYDGTAVSSVAPVLSGTTYDAVGTAATQVFDNRNAGTGKTLTATGLLMADGNGGANYAVNYVNDTAGVITPAALTVTAQADSRTYDGTTASSVAPVLSGTAYDAVGATATQTFGNRNAGTGKTLAASGLVMADGNGGANYAVSYVNNTAGVITPASLTVTAQADSRVYDGTAVSSAAPVLSGTTYDAVGTAATQVFDNRNAGTGKTLTASGLVMADANGGGNYAVSYVNNNSGVITPAALTVTAQADSRIYDGTTSSSAAPVLSGTTYDAVGTAATQSFDNRNAGTGKTLTPSGLLMADGNGGANYTLIYVTNTAGVITPAALTVTAQADGRVYDGTTASSAAPVLSGTIYDAVGTAATQVFDNRNAGTGKTLTASGLVMVDGNSGANYATTYVNSTAGVITPAALTVTAQADSRVYDGTTASGATPVLSGATYDAVGTAATQSFANRNAGTGKTLTASGLVMADGNAGANYAVNYVNNAAGVITRASLTITAQADSRTYNGTTASSVAPVLSGTTYDAVGMAATQLFDNRNVGTGKMLTATGLLMADGNGGANYTVNYVNNTAGVITPASLTVTAQADNRVYNGTLSSSIAPVLSGTTYDVVGIAATQTFDNRNAGTGKTLTAGGLVMGDSNGGANYAISYVDSTAGVITPASLSITADDAQRQAGAPNPTFTGTYSGLVPGDSPASLNGTLDFQTAATTSSLPGSYAITPFGQSSSNYIISYVDGVLVVTTLPSPPKFPDWARFDPQSVAAPYTTPAWSNHQLPTLSLTVGTGGLNVDE